jgi:hypothetical protein
VSPVDRFWSYVDKTGECWLWTGSLHNLGYPNRFLVDGERIYPHRYSYELVHGPIPDGLTIDHLCRVRHCVNPEHLEAVTHRENLRRSPVQVTTVNARKTRCIRGHRFSGRDKRGYRVCHTCIRLRRKATA